MPRIASMKSLWMLRARRPENARVSVVRRAAELNSFARCSGAAVTVYRAGQADVGAFRKDLLAATTASDGSVLIVNYSRGAVGQTGSGHFSPIGGFDAATDQALVLDTARFKYPPHWMPVELLFAAMQERDADTGDARGWMLLGKGAVDRP